MKNKYVPCAVVLVLILALIGYGIYFFATFDFVGKTKEEVDAANKRMDAMLLSAEYHNGPDNISLQLTDSVNAEIFANLKIGNQGVFRTYVHSNDTITLEAITIDNTAPLKKPLYMCT